MDFYPPNGSTEDSGVFLTASQSLLVNGQDLRDIRSVAELTGEFISVDVFMLFQCVCVTCLSSPSSPKARTKPFVSICPRRKIYRGRPSGRQVKHTDTGNKISVVVQHSRINRWTDSGTDPRHLCGALTFSM